MSGFEIYTKKEKFAWDIACRDIGVTFVVVSAIFTALFSVFAMPYSFSYIYGMQMIAIPMAVFAVWGERYKLPRFAGIFLVGIVSYFYLKVNLYNGILPCLNSAIKLINKCYSIQLSQLDRYGIATYTSAAEVDKLSFLWILCVLEFLLGMVVLKVLKIQRGRFFAIFLFLIPVLLGIFCGKLPEIASGSFLLAAIFLFLVTSHQREKRSWIRAWMSAFLFLLVVWLGAHFAEKQIYEYKQEHLKEYKETKIKLIEARRIDIADWIPEKWNEFKGKVNEQFSELQMGVDWNKNLQGLDKLERTGEILDEIILEDMPTEKVYWPMFYGYVYTGKQWTSKDSTEGIYDTLTKVEEFWSTKKSYNVNQIAKLIDTYYEEENFKYTTNPGKMPEHMDFVEGFLFEAKQGFCVHFATSATVIYQMCDKEARYVEGYMLGPGDFKRQSDGSYKAIVTDYMAHAWCETYDTQSNSWTVREHTLSSGLPIQHPTQEPTKEEQITQIPTVTPTVQATERPTNVPSKFPQEEQPTQIPMQGDENGGNSLGNGTIEKTPIFEVLWKIIKIVLLYVFGMIGTILLLLCTVIVQRKIRVKRRRCRFNSKHVKKAILLIYREIQELCMYAGAKDKELWRRENISQMIEQFPQLSESEWEWIYDCVQRTMFSNDLMLAAEQKQMYQMYLRLRKGIFEQLKGCEKIWFLYGRAL